MPVRPGGGEKFHSDFSTATLQPVVPDASAMSTEDVNEFEVLLILKFPGFVSTNFANFESQEQTPLLPLLIAADERIS